MAQRECFVVTVWLWGKGEGAGRRSADSFWVRKREQKGRKRGKGKEAVGRINNLNVESDNNGGGRGRGVGRQVVVVAGWWQGPAGRWDEPCAAGSGQGWRSEKRNTREGRGAEGDRTGGAQEA